MKKITENQLNEAIEAFDYEGELIGKRTFGSGHINDTYLLTFKIGKIGKLNVILQRLNHEIFTQPAQLMENITGVTGYLREQIIETGGDPYRETLNVIPTKDGASFYRDILGDYWRSYIYITDASSYDEVENPEHFYQSALAFGHFQRLLAHYPASTLHETIEGFHDTRKRYKRFLQVVEEDKLGLAKDVKAEIEFVKERENIAYILMDLLEAGKLPLRVTHNDTKLNNIMLDNKTGKGICVVDLDTVMPGLSANDFGDSIRFGASTAAEDEKDLEKVSCDMDLFSLYTKGFLKGCDGRLTEEEIAQLPMGAKVMTFECGIRFLADYLEGDVYFKTERKGQNLDRARTQFKLVKDMEEKWEEMQTIVQELS